MNRHTQRLIAFDNAEGKFQDYVGLAQHWADDGDSKARITARLMEKVDQDHWEETSDLSDYLFELVEEELNKVEWGLYADAVVEQVEFPAPAKGSREWFYIRADLKRDAMKEER